MAADVQSRGNEFHASTPRQIFSAPGGIEWVNTAPDARILVRIRTEQQNTPLGAEASSMYGVESESQAKSEIPIKSKLGNEYRDSNPGQEG
jgi:hypothetical protein